MKLSVNRSLHSIVGGSSCVTSDGVDQETCGVFLTSSLVFTTIRNCCVTYVVIITEFSRDTHSGHQG